MAEYGTSFRRTSSGSNREDPRLTRRDSSSATKESSPEKTQSNWQSHYSTMQTSYQHLQGTMYSDPNQYPTPGYQSAYAGYTNYNPSGYSSYEGYGREHQAAGYGTTANMQPGPPGDAYPQGGWAPVGSGYLSNQQQTGSSTDKQQHSDGIAQEIEHQKAELIKQRDEYNKRVSVLRKELDLLRRQKQQLMQDHKSDRDTDMILRENGKLQIEIQNKLKDAFKVIDIFTGLIGDEGKRGRKEADSESSSPSTKSKRQPSEMPFDSRCNYVHYDPELHWCRMCDIFPKTAKDLLIHLQSKEHRANVQEDEAPWHKLPPEQEFPYIEGAPTKRHPIKGLQFFVSTTAWYCRLCDSWIGDLHCASLHLKSINHSQNYSNFVEQNPHWEIEWLKDREKSLSRLSRHNKSSDSDDSHEKKKKHKKHSLSPNQSRDKRKKKKSKKRRKDSSESSSSSSSSSSSGEEGNKDTSKSIHVAMRNKMKLQAQMLMNEELSGKWEAIGRLVEERKKKEAEIVEKHEEDQMINQWMSVKQPQDKDKALLSNLKDRLKQKQEAEKVKFAEMERRRLEKEKEEREMKEREEKEAREREEAKRKEREDLDRLKEIREQVKFKTRSGSDKERYRRKRSSSRSPDYKRRDSSPSGDHRRRGSPDKHRRYENGNRSSEYEDNSRHKRKYDDKKGPPPPPPYKKLPFIGRMPLFKNKKMDDKSENREVKKEDYDVPRPSRFQPGNLARAFIPEPEVVCFPKLSCYPEILPPPPPVVPKIAEPPAPPKISETIPKAPPPPKIKPEEEVKETVGNETAKDSKSGDNTTVEDMMIMEDESTINPMSEYQDPGYDYYDYTMMYQPPVFDYNVTSDNGEDQSGVPLSHTMPLQPPPLPPDDPNDDLALLGLSSDDLAVQMVK
ncbi:zinc finger matrin-type protein CG9776-like isoform X1 [Onthophagus taurus]|uniref:zinc finger matrin-type protein CG9776-like isoform X1 n=2 Tax=Onthophagus taurus TaxID=166361 RepID=UPI0039BDF27B